jgi:hypothetical protein
MAQNYVLLERIELNASAASVTFSNIPQSGYTDLKVVTSARSTSGGAVAYSMFMRMNNLTTSIYLQRALEGSGSGASSFSQSGVDTAVRVGLITGTGATASTFSNSEIYIPNYTSANNKSVSIDTVAETNATTQYMNMIAYLINSTAAITDLTFSTEPAGGVTFAANSTFSLYGLAAVGTTPVIAPKASGGNIQTDGTYWYHTFLSTGAFVPNQALSCDAIVVAGGAGGAHAGGGAGGYLTFTSQALTANTSYTTTIGAGSAGTSGTVQSSNGSDSQFGSLTLVKGGGGAGVGGSYTPPRRDGKTGGSGGGGAPDGSSVGIGGSPESGQGYAGGNSGTGAGTYPGGGGGGAGQAGATGVNATGGGKGGNGLSSAITGGSTTGVGQNVSGTYYLAGGGGGGSDSGAGAGGSGGGGAGASTTSTAGTINTGGGGGGSSNAGASSANGGSGVVIIRYTIA